MRHVSTGRPPGLPKAESDDERCQAVYREKYKKDPNKIGTRCERRAIDGDIYCSRHVQVPDEKRCRANLSKNHPTHPGERCPQRAMKGQTVCYRHGGAAPNSRRAAARRIAEAELEAKVTKLLAATEVQSVDNPLEAYAQFAGEVFSFKAALGERVNALTEIRYESKAGGEQTRAEISLFEKALDRCDRVLANYARLKIDERLAAISEQQAEKVLAAIDAALEYLGVSGEQAIGAKKAAARRLRSV
jgi:hypothetical protein